MECCLFPCNKPEAKQRLKEKLEANELIPVDPGIAVKDLSNTNDECPTNKNDSSNKNDEECEENKKAENDDDKFASPDSRKVRVDTDDTFLTAEGETQNPKLSLPGTDSSVMFKAVTPRKNASKENDTAKIDENVLNLNDIEAKTKLAETAQHSTLNAMVMNKVVKDLQDDVAEKHPDSPSAKVRITAKAGVKKSLNKKPSMFAKMGTSLFGEKSPGGVKSSNLSKEERAAAAHMDLTGLWMNIAQENFEGAMEKAGANYIKRRAARMFNFGVGKSKHQFVHGKNDDGDDTLEVTHVGGLAGTFSYMLIANRVPTSTKGPTGICDMKSYWSEDLNEFFSEFEQDGKDHIISRRLITEDGEVKKWSDENKKTKGPSVDSEQFMEMIWKLDKKGGNNYTVAKRIWLKLSDEIE